jgi:acyl-CoA synthetase (NDP forming)
MPLDLDIPPAPTTRAAAGRAHRLDSLLNPRSVAVVGASERNHYSNLAVNALKRIGFDGRLHLVNPRGAVIYGQQAATSVAAIGEPVDAAYFCVPHDALLDSAAEAIEAGVRNLIIVSSGFAEIGEEGARRERQLADLCAAAGVRVLGPNCLGYRNMLDRVALGSIPFVEQPAAASIGLIAASGSVATMVAHYGIQQGLGFTHVIATGNEMNVAAADIVDYLVDIPEVRAIALFLETVKDTALFAAAAERARLARKPVIAIKAGAAPATAAIAAAHTSAVVGDDRVFDAACDRYGVVRVDTFEDLVCTAGTLAATGPIDRPGVAFISMSGGIAENASDVGAKVGVEFPQFAPETCAQLGDVLSELGQMHNPLDLTGAAVRDEQMWDQVATIVSRDPQIGLTLLNWDVPNVAEPSMASTVEAVGRSCRLTATPSLIIGNYERAVNEHGLAYLQQHGMSFSLPGVAHGMVATARLAWWSERLGRPPAPSRIPASVAAAARPQDERQTLQHLAACGAPVIPTIVAADGEAAAGAATSLGGPVAMKILSPDIAHKSEVGGVVLNIDGPAAAVAAYDQILRSVGAHAPDARIEGVLLSPMRSGGIEMLVGVARDPQWGLVLALGLGGIWVEVLQDTALCLLPASEDEIIRALRSLKAARLFDGYRGAPPVDLAAVAQAAMAIGEAAAALGPDLTALEVNPLFVRGKQVEALDGLATFS